MDALERIRSFQKHLVARHACAEDSPAVYRPLQSHDDLHAEGGCDHAPEDLD